MSIAYEVVYNDMVAAGALPRGMSLGWWKQEGHEADADVILALAGRSADVERSTLRNRVQISAKIWAVMQLTSEPGTETVLEHLQLVHSWVLFYQREPSAMQSLVAIAEKQ